MQEQMNDKTGIERALSDARLKGYQTPYAKSVHLNPVALYRWNIILSESFYPLLHIIEVGLRNAIFEGAAERYGETWLLKGDHLDPKELKELQNPINYLKRRSKLDTGHLIAELSFGFWCGLLDRRYEHRQVLWPTLLRTVFPYLKNRKIHLIRKRFDRIRKLRNRVYHYEPIWHWQDLLQQHQEILEAISWIEPDLLKLVEIERFLEIYHLGPK